MNINLHIESLVLDGLPLEAGNRAQLQAAVESELARLLARDGGQNWQTGGAVPRVRAADIQVTAQGGAGQLGRQIAGSIFTGLREVK